LGVKSKSESRIPSLNNMLQPLIESDPGNRTVLWTTLTLMSRLCYAGNHGIDGVDDGVVLTIALKSAECLDKWRTQN
jgi:hypothetical protein